MTKSAIDFLSKIQPILRFSGTFNNNKSDTNAQTSFNDPFITNSGSVQVPMVNFYSQAGGDETQF